jgi:hypothetical protein
LAGDGFEVGRVIFGRHLDVVEEELGEGGVAVEDVGALGVDVDEINCVWALGELGFDAAEELFEDGRLERVEEEEERGFGGEFEVKRVLLEDFDGSEARGGDVGCVSFGPVGDVLAGDGGERGVELDADDLAEVELAGDEQAAALAGADVDEGIAGDGVATPWTWSKGWMGKLVSLSRSCGRGFVGAGLSIGFAGLDLDLDEGIGLA